MSEPLLVVVLEHGSGLDDQPQFGAARRLRVRAHVVPEPVRQAADQDVRIGGHRFVEAARNDPRRRRLPPPRRLGGEKRCASSKQGGERGGRGKTAIAKDHSSILTRPRPDDEDRTLTSPYVLRQAPGRSSSPLLSSRPPRCTPHTADTGTADA